MLVCLANLCVLSPRTEPVSNEPNSGSERWSPLFKITQQVSGKAGSHGKIYLKKKNLKKFIYGGKEGDSGMYGESNMETYITICKIDSHWEFAVWLRELTPGLCNNLEKCDGEGGSRGRGHRYTYGWFMLMFGRNQHNTIKQLFFN